jgi:glycosyltransferase involved in cell wall biosynthesis
MERRLLELIKYLKQNDEYSLTLVIAEDIIHYKYANELGIPIKLIKRKDLKYDPTLFIRFFRFCRTFKPDIIHTWGRFATFNAIPAKIICRKPLVSNLINSARESFRQNSHDRFFHKIDILFSDIILSNSEAGIKNFKINSHKALVIRNGVHTERFEGEFDKTDVRLKFKINTPYVVVMVARFGKSKDYDLFIDIAREMYNVRKDVTFLGVGDGPQLSRIRDRIKKEEVNNVILVGNQNEVESLIYASDIGLLCTFSEGISNTIIEYMGMGKPVIVTDTFGGSRELVIDGETGFCTERNAEEVIKHINFLLNNQKLRTEMGNKGKERIFSEFTIERMGRDFENLYKNMMRHTKRGAFLKEHVN